MASCDARGFRGRWILLCAAMAIAASIGTEQADAAVPRIDASWTTEVAISSASLHAEINPGGLSTSYRFEYVPDTVYRANLEAGHEGFSGAARIPAGMDGNAGAGAIDRDVVETLRGLQSETTYRYRVLVSNAEGSAIAPERSLTTSGLGRPLSLLDGRSWELVSPVEKNGGEIQGFGGNAGGGVLQSGAQGGVVTFSSTSSFAGGGDGSPGASQYISRRTDIGWLTENVTAAAYGGAYGEEPDGVPYQLFSTDLTRGLLVGIPNLPLARTGAPAGYENYYLRSEGGEFSAFLTQAGVASLTLSPAELRLSFAGASPDLSHVILSTCAALTHDATEAPTGTDGCDAASPNLYDWSGSGLQLVNLLPGQALGTPGAALADRIGAISTDGGRVYWTLGGNLYLREGGRSVQVDGGVGGGGHFETATPNGAFAYFTKGEHLYEYAAATETAVDLTPAGGVRGVLGVAADGSSVYFATAGGIFLAQAGSVRSVADAPEVQNFPPSTGVARVSADGRRLLFVSRVELTSYENLDANTKQPDMEIYLFDDSTDAVTCVSCNPSGERPMASVSLPGAIPNGNGEGATRAYKPRALADDGRRIFFETSDPLSQQDTNHDRDVYEWEMGGIGSCASSRGCVQLISSGRSGGGSFVDASADGADVFFLTDGSLVKADPGAVDLYDAREGGGFPEAETPIPCEEDACQPLPSPPDDPSPGSLVPSTENPPAHIAKPRKHRSRKQRKHRRHPARQRGRR